jgi:hypothetical protein
MQRMLNTHNAKYGAGVMLLALAVFLNAAPLWGETSDAELAKKTQNPIADLTIVPFQYNQDYGIGPVDAMKTTLNIQPVIPIGLNQDWNLILRTIIPVIDAESPAPGVAESRGLGDITQSFFFSPKKPVAGWTVGVGPVFLYPAASHDELGAGKWGIGPTFVVLQQESGFTYGLLANHIVSFAGDSGRQDVSSTFLQPFFSYTTKTYTTIGLNTESTYDWKASQWTVPINFQVTQLLKISGQPMSFQFGYRYYAEAPTGGPDWGLRFVVTFLFPK